MSDGRTLSAADGRDEPLRVAEPPSSNAARTRFTQLEYEAVLANAYIGIAFMRDRKFFLCNPKFAEMFGWQPDELVGQPGEVVCPSRESYEALGRITTPLLSAGKRVDLEWEVRRRDGSTFLARMIAKAISEADSSHGTVWIVEDVTVAKRRGDEVTRLLREQEAILDNASSGIAFVRDRRVVRCNRRFEELHGCGKEDLIGQPMRMFLARDEDHARLGESYAQLAKGGTHSITALSRRKDGSTWWSRITGRAMDSTSPHKGAIWMIEDISEPRGAAEELDRELAEQKSLLDNVVVGIAFVRFRRVVRCNGRYEKMYGYDAGEAIGATTREFYFTDEEYVQVLAHYAEVDRGQTHSSEQWLRRRDGSGFWCRVTGHALEPNNLSKGAVWLYEDITETRRASEEVRRAFAEQQLILDNATVGIAFVRDHVIRRCNRQLEEMLGYASDELIGKSTEAIHASPEGHEHVKSGSYAKLALGAAYTEERQVRRRDESLLWCKVVARAVDPAQADEGSIWIFGDVSAEHATRESLERVVAERTAELKAANARLGAEIGDRRQAEERAQHLADHDALTGLPNRRLLEDRLTQALALSQRNRKQTAVMFVDLDHFKAINDSLGHAVGDQVLQEVAQRLVKQLRIGDTICRVGGDEFVVVLPEAERSTDAANVATKIIETLSQPVQVVNRALSVTPSIGIAVYPEDGRDAQTLIRNADAAMYHAKELGRANYQFFAEQMNRAASRRLALENDLRRAVQNGELVLHYQPVAELPGGVVVAHETLVRWQHPQQGLVPPADFVQLAEDTGLIVGIGEWVLREACRWATFIGVERGVQVAVNLSARQFNDPELIELVRRVLVESGLPPTLLVLEITETTAMQQTDVAVSTLRQLKELGVSLTISDFGTGYSRLTYLRRLQVDRLKIDRTFVADVPGDRNAELLVSGLIGLAHALDLKVLAEGVETAAQRDFLAAQGCDMVQGQLIGPPVDADSAAGGYV